MNREEREKLQRLQDKQVRETYRKKVQNQLGISTDVLDVETPYTDFNDLGLEYKYKYIKEVLNNEFEFNNQEVCLSNSGKIHFIKGKEKHIDFSNSIFDLGEKTEFREMTVCMGDGPRTWNKKDIDSVVFESDRICKSCLNKKRKMAAARNALLKVGVKI